MNKIKIECVCGFGIGTSMILKMNVDKVLDKLQFPARVTTSDLSQAGGDSPSLILTSPIHADVIRGKIPFPVYTIKNFMDKDEIEALLVNVLRIDN